MSLLSYIELCELVEQGVIDAPLENVNGNSIDIRLGNHFLVEVAEPWVITKDTRAADLFVDLAKKENIKLQEIELKDGEMLVLRPNQVCLAQTVEEFNLPLDITSEYVLKSSQARNFWSHQLAGFCDSGWHGSKLTMEFKNENEHNFLMLTPSMKAGQMKFTRGVPVPGDVSYAVKGKYNNQNKVTASKGID